MNYTYIKQLIDKVLCDLSDLKNNAVKKLKILFNDVEIEIDAKSINFEGTGVEDVTKDSNGNVTVTIQGGTDNVQSDWEQTNIVDPSFIQNKPTPTDLIFTGNVTTTQTGPNEITVNIFGGSSENFVNTNLTALSSRVHNFSSYGLEIKNTIYDEILTGENIESKFFMGLRPTQEGGDISPTIGFIQQMGTVTSYVYAQGSVLSLYNNNNIIMRTSSNVYLSINNNDLLTVSGGLRIVPITGGPLFNLTVTTTPIAPIDGDMWLESNSSTGLKIRLNGTTYTVNLV